MARRKWKESKQQPSKLPGPAVSGYCLVSFHFLRAIHHIRPVHTVAALYSPPFFALPFPLFDFSREGGGQVADRGSPGQEVCQVRGQGQAGSAAEEARRAQEAPLGVHAVPPERQRRCNRLSVRGVFELGVGQGLRGAG